LHPPGSPRALVGINPGIRSAAIGHHFAGYSNRFWSVLYDAGLTPGRLRAEDDVRLPGLGYGVTNLIPRCTPGIDTLRREEYSAGVVTLGRKVRRWKPQVVAFVGVTLFRVVFGRRPGDKVALGLQPDVFEGARCSSCPTRAAATPTSPIRRCSPPSEPSLPCFANSTAM
jgi:TDG/mug DNA glycosylase family protein